MDFISFDNINGLWTILSGFFGGTSIIGYFAYRKINQRLKEAELKQKETDVQSGVFAMYEERLTHANATIEGHNETISHQSQTIATLNSALDDKTQRIRTITDELYDSERTINALNEALVAKTEENGQLKVQIAKLRSWRCEKSDCDGRIPPSRNIVGKSFNEDIQEAAQ